MEDALGPVIAGGRTLRMSLSRWRGSAGAGGMFGAGTPPADEVGESALARYASSSAAAATSSGGISVVHAASLPFPDVPPAAVESDQNELNWFGCEWCGLASGVWSWVWWGELEVAGAVTAT